jgi:hypothetical protein
MARILIFIIVTRGTAHNVGCGSLLKKNSDIPDLNHSYRQIFLLDFAS